MMPGAPNRGEGGTFTSWIVAFCDRFLAQRTFELIVGPALADFEFEELTRRRGPFANRAAVMRALAGGMLHEVRLGSGGFLKLTLLSMSYFMFPVLVSGSYFKTWTEYFTAASVMVVLSLAPVIVCFWPARPPARPGQ